MIYDISYLLIGNQVIFFTKFLFFNLNSQLFYIKYNLMIRDQVICLIFNFIFSPNFTSLIFISYLLMGDQVFFTPNFNKMPLIIYDISYLLMGVQVFSSDSSLYHHIIKKSQHHIISSSASYHQYIRPDRTNTWCDSVTL